MRRVLIAVAVLVLPTLVSLIVYLLASKKIPTSRVAVGSVQTLAGDGSPRFIDGKAQAASFSDPFGIAVDRKGNLYVADGGEANRIRRIDTNGNVETVAGSTEGFADGRARSSAFNTPSGLAINKQGEIIIADTSNNRIRKIDSEGNVATIAGSGATGHRDGNGPNAEFDGPVAVAIHPDGDVIVADTYNDRIRRISRANEVSTVAGSGSPGFADEAGTAALFNTPSGVAVDDQGNIFVADTGNSAVRKITADGQVTTIAARERNTPDRRNDLRHPVGVVATHDGFLFVSCEDGIYRITPEGEVQPYAGGKIGFASGAGANARFNSPSGIAIDKSGVIFVADSQNYLIRAVIPQDPTSQESADAPSDYLVQPGPQPTTNVEEVVPRISLSDVSESGSLPWPLDPQNQWHEIVGVMGEARGAPGGIALDHLHSGLDIRGPMGAAVLTVRNEKVTSPRPNWDFEGTNEGITVGLISYIHVRVGRDAGGNVDQSGRFKAANDSLGNLHGVRVRRGTRFRPGEFVGTINSLYHVHVNVGPWNAQMNPLDLMFPGFKDTTPPTVEPNGIELVSVQGASPQRLNGRVVVSGDVKLWVTAYDLVDGNSPRRKLGLYRLGYQVVTDQGTPVPGFDEPVFNILFNRLPPDDPTVTVVYATGSGVSAYGHPTRFKFIATNRVRDGRAEPGVLRTSNLAPGDYTIRVFAEDRSGNRAAGPQTELKIRVEAR
jgi:sugar lactone lactonase YvrE